METDQKAKVCYVVECSSGSWDDYHSWIAGIFPNEVDAIKLKEEITIRVDTIKDTAPFDEDKLESMSVEESIAYYEWFDVNEDALNFNSAEAVEYPFGEAVGVFPHKER